MTLSAEVLDSWDRCERRFAFAQKYDSTLISPLGLLYKAVESALVAPDPEQEAKDATMRVASTHDLILTELSSFLTVRHVGYLAGIIAVALRERLGTMERVPATPEWESGLFESESGTRHRIELVSHFDDDRLRSAAHSWRVIGELAALRAPLTLTAVVIGPQRGGRRHSEWTKGFRHPANRALRFAPRSAKKAGFSDGWLKVWRDMETIPTARWLGQMRQDGALESLIVSREIAYHPDDNRMVAAQAEMRQIEAMMKTASESSPMRRSSCDEFGGCSFQTVCYSPTPVTPADFPQLYQIRDTPEEAPALRRFSDHTYEVWRLAPAVRKERHPPAAQT